MLKNTPKTLQKPETRSIIYFFVLVKSLEPHNLSSIANGVMKGHRLVTFFNVFALLNPLAK